MGRGPRETKVKCNALVTLTSGSVTVDPLCTNWFPLPRLRELKEPPSGFPAEKVREERWWSLRKGGVGARRVGSWYKGLPRKSCNPGIQI